MGLLTRRRHDDRLRVVAQVSIARMFVAGVLPGLMMIGLSCVTSPAGACVPRQDARDSIVMTLRERLYAARRLFPAWSDRRVMGSIYAAWPRRPKRPSSASWARC